VKKGKQKHQSYCSRLCINVSPESTISKKMSCSRSHVVKCAAFGVAAGIAIHYGLNKLTSSETPKMLSATAAKKWKGRHCLSVKEISREDLEELFEIADRMHELVEEKGKTAQKTFCSKK
jgi:hypothetical protein